MNGDPTPLLIDGVKRAVTFALVCLATLAVAGAMGANAKPNKPPKPKPSLTLLTGTEEGVLRRGQIKVRVDTNRGSAARVTNHVVVDGYPSDFPFNVPAEKKRFKDRTAVVKFNLSPRMEEVLDFAIKTCRGATVSLGVKVGRGSASLSQALALPRDCVDTG